LPNKFPNQNVEKEQDLAFINDVPNKVWLVLRGDIQLIAKIITY
jgi:hypothetical protein